MRRRARRAIVGLVAVLGAASCGPDVPAPAAPSDAAPRDAPSSAVRARATADPDRALPAAEVERLLAAWIAAKDDDDALRAIEDALVAGGSAVLDRLIAWVGDGNQARDAALVRLLPLFGEAAADRLLVVLRDGDRAASEAAIRQLGEFPRSVFDGARGEAVCRALLDRARKGDEDEASLALDRMQSFGPSARCVAADVARLWCDAGAPRRAAASMLQRLGTDAAPAAPVIAGWLRAAAAGPEPSTEELRDEREARVEEAFEILDSVGTADPSILADLRAVAAGGASEWQHRVAWLLSHWGDTAAPAAPELIAMLRSPDEEVRSFAARVLAGIPKAREAARGPLLEALTATDESQRIVWSMFFHGFMYDPAFAARLAEIAPSLPAESLREVCETLASWDGIDTRALVAALIARPDPASREGALDLWAGHAAADAVPPAEIQALLGDGDASVRIVASLRLAGRPGVDAARVRDVAVAEVAARGNSWYAALDLLGRLAPTDAKAFEAIVAALDDPQTCLAALASLPPGESLIPGRHPVAIAAALPDALDTHYVNSTALALLRFDGGADALVSAVQIRLAAFESATAQEQNAAISDLTPVITLLGPRAAAVRPALARIYRGLSPGPYEDGNRRALDRAIAEIDGDLEAIALTSWADRAMVQRFLAAGDAGRRALVLYAGSGIGISDGNFAELFHDVRADDEIVAAAASQASADPFARERRTGAATLAPLLPIERAREVLRALSKDDQVKVQRAVVDGWNRVAASHADAVTAADIAPLLSSTDWRVRPAAIHLAAALGPHGADLVPALRAIRDDRTVPGWLDAAIALWPITRDPAETLPMLRDWMQQPARRDDDASLDAAAAAAAFAEMPFTVEDIPAIVRAIRDDRVALEAFAELLARFGPDAAPAIPVLRLALRGGVPGDVHMGERTIPDGWIDTEAGAAARVLVAIGPAARVAIPDLRARIDDVGDREGVLRDALRKLEALGR